MPPADADDPLDDPILLQYPSDDFPGPTPVRITAPGDWTGLVMADADLAVARPNVVGRFRPNVLVRVHRIARTSEPAMDVDVLFAGDDGVPGMEVVTDERGDEHGGAPTRRRVTHFDGPENVRLRSRRVLVYVPVSEHAADIVSVVGTSPVDAPDGVAAVVDAVVDSLQVGVER